MIMGNKQRGSDGRFVSSVDLEGVLSADSPMAKVLAGASAVSDAVVEAEGAPTDESADTLTDVGMPTEALTDAGHDEVSGEVPAEGTDAEAPTEMPTEKPVDALDGMPFGVLEPNGTYGPHFDDEEGDAPVEEERSSPRSRDVRRSDVKSLIASRRSESDRRMGTETKGFGARAVVASRKAGSSLGSARSVIRDRLAGNLRAGVGGSKCTTKVIG